jgi:NADH dehydrogenase
VPDEPTHQPSADTRTIAIAGATGFIGRHLAAAFLDRGFRVRALVRSADKAAAVLPASDRLSLVMGGVFDDRAVTEFADGADVLVNAVGIRLEQPPEVTFERMHPLATDRLIQAAEQAGVGRFILISALGVRPNASDDYSATKHNAETLLRRSRLPWTIFRPSIVHGPDAGFIDMLKDWVRGRAAPFFFMPYFARVDITPTFPPKPPKLHATDIQPVHVDDLAAAVVNAAGNPDAVGEVYNITGPETLSWPDMYKHVRSEIPLGEAKKPIVPVPAPLASVMAALAKPLGLASTLPYSPSEPVLASMDSTADHRKAAEHLGFDPAPFRASFTSYAKDIP